MTGFRTFLLIAAFSLAAPQVFAAELASHIYSDAELLAMTGNKYASGEVPLGDGHYVTDAPRRGYIYLCHVMQGGGGAQADGNWIHGSTWNFLSKPAVQGQVTWDNAQFSNRSDGAERLLSGNGLPINHATGIFPVQPSDPVYRYDRNPNSIAAQNLKDLLPANPTYSSTPYCMGGESGMMLTGVPLFNGFDAGMRDAAAHEAQDSCSGHPQQKGQYHYHSLSACIKNVGVKTVIGYALDGFPITGPVVATGHILNTDNLDECHGITSEIVEDGQKKITYHYVMTQDFPYSVSCFRAKPVRTGPSDFSQGGQQNGMQGMPPMQNGGGQRQPPAEALAACNGQGEGANCGFTSPRGDQISGACRIPPGLQQTICVPAHPPQ
jgi:hypothetical protein